MIATPAPSAPLAPRGPPPLSPPFVDPILLTFYSPRLRDTKPRGPAPTQDHPSAPILASAPASPSATRAAAVRLSKVPPQCAHNPLRSGQPIPPTPHC